MENMRVESLAEVSERNTPQRVLFTYYQGDINSVVDEHFSRALKKANLPKDLSIKASSPKDPQVSKPRSRTKAIKTEPPTSTWNPSSPDWSKSPFPSSSGLAQFSSAESPVASQGVIMGPGVWSYPNGPGAGFDVTRLYQLPGPAETSSGSFLSMLHMDRPAGGVLMDPKVESPGWDSPSAFRDSVGNRISLDSGVQVPEKTKDLYWY
ncbi:uncharacterized protein LOC143112240 [Alosa pseudoharengus]|uniref:uncharacterized protein LOC143112240 n=1 Tax=Alosa pseudoharengus TaxID=34774 RepID=UPI003F8C59EB